MMMEWSSSIFKGQLNRPKADLYTQEWSVCEYLGVTTSHFQLGGIIDDAGVNIVRHNAEVHQRSLIDSPVTFNTLLSAHLCRM